MSKWVSFIKYGLICNVFTAMSIETSRICQKNYRFFFIQLLPVVRRVVKCTSLHSQHILLTSIRNCAGFFPVIFTYWHMAYLNRSLSKIKCLQLRPNFAENCWIFQMCIFRCNHVLREWLHSAKTILTIRRKCKSFCFVTANYSTKKA